jgi:hypothetical protein
MRNIQIALVLLLLTPLSIFAADISDLSNGLARNFDQNQRKQLVEKLDLLFESLDHAVPSLKPSEQKWVNEEREAIASITNKDTQLKRLVDLHESVEFQQENIKRLIKSIRDALRCVLRAEDIGREIYCWSVVSFHLTDKGEFDGAIAILKNGKKLYDTGSLYIGGPSSGYGYFYNSFGRAIQEYFVIPYLAGSLRK